METIKKVAVTALVVLAAGGCTNDENIRLAEMAERNLERQDAQDARNTELQREVAEGTRRLVEADAAAREGIVELHRDVQAERSELGRQRDQLETERREIASDRIHTPIIAEAIKAFGLLLACMVPLLIALQVLRRADDSADNAAIAELLLSDLSDEKPNLIRLVQPTASADGDAIVRRLGDHSDRANNES